MSLRFKGITVSVQLCVPSSIIFTFSVQCASHIYIFYHSYFFYPWTSPPGQSAGRSAGGLSLSLAWMSLVLWSIKFLFSPSSFSVESSWNDTIFYEWFFTTYLIFLAVLLQIKSISTLLIGKIQLGTLPILSGLWHSGSEGAKRLWIEPLAPHSPFLGHPGTPVVAMMTSTLESGRRDDVRRGCTSRGWW